MVKNAGAMSGNACLAQETDRIADRMETLGVVAAVAPFGVAFAKNVVIEMHHLLPQAKRFKQFFKRAGLNIEEFMIPLNKETHRLKPGGVHTVSGGNWNRVWDDFFKANPNATKQEILEQLARMRRDF